VETNAERFEITLKDRRGRPFARLAKPTFHFSCFRSFQMFSFSLNFIAQSSETSKTASAYRLKKKNQNGV